LFETEDYRYQTTKVKEIVDKPIKPSDSFSLLPQVRFKPKHTFSKQLFAPSPEPTHLSQSQIISAEKSSPNHHLKDSLKSRLRISSVHKSLTRLPTLIDRERRFHKSKNTKQILEVYGYHKFHEKVRKRVMSQLGHHDSNARLPEITQGKTAGAFKRKQHSILPTSLPALVEVDHKGGQDVAQEALIQKLERLSSCAEDAEPELNLIP
jgi:hypothetical protein